MSQIKKNMQEQESKTRLRESVKIRHYIMNLIYRHPNEKMLIPGSNELAAMFGVGRATVTRVLKNLAEEGFLEGHRGIGTFTKIQNFIPVLGEMPPLVGLLAGDGKYFYYPYQVWSLMANSGLALTRNGCNVRTLSLTGPDEESLFAEISHQYLDGLVAVDMGPERAELIRRLHEEAGLKVILQVNGDLDASTSGIDCFCFDFRKAGVEIGRRLIAEGRSKLHFIFLNPVTTFLLEGINSAYAAAGKKVDVTTYTWKGPEVFREISERLRKDVPDALYAHGEHYRTIRKLLNESGIDPIEQCRLIAETHAIHSEYQGLCIEIPFEETGFAIGERIARHFRENQLPAEHRKIPLTVYPKGI